MMMIKWWMMNDGWWRKLVSVIRDGLIFNHLLHKLTLRLVFQKHAIALWFLKLHAVIPSPVMEHLVTERSTTRFGLSSLKAAPTDAHSGPDCLPSPPGPPGPPGLPSDNLLRAWRKHHWLTHGVYCAFDTCRVLSAYKFSEKPALLKINSAYQSRPLLVH